MISRRKRLWDRLGLALALVGAVLVFVYDQHQLGQIFITATILALVLPGLPDKLDAIARHRPPLFPHREDPQ